MNGRCPARAPVVSLWRIVQALTPDSDNSEDLSARLDPIFGSSSSQQDSVSLAPVRLAGRVRAAFAPAQADIILALLTPRTQEDGHLSMKEAAALVGWTYGTFRKEPAFSAANVAPQGRHPRFRRSVLLRVAENIRNGAQRRT